MTYRILVVDDEPQIHTFIRISLTTEGFTYLGAESIASAQKQIMEQAPHVIVLDLGLPDGDGLTLLQQVRQQAKTPVLILTARDQEETKIQILEAGANDYLSKPFGIRELIARIKVLVRDLVDDVSVSDIRVVGQLTLQHSTHQVWLNKEEVSLTNKEFSFLAMLADNPDGLVKQETLLREIWGETHQLDTHYLRILVSQLRKKLNDSADKQKLIKTESGLGYRLLVPADKRSEWYPE